MAFTADERDAIAGYLGTSCDPVALASLDTAIDQVEAVPSAETRIKDDQVGSH